MSANLRLGDMAPNSKATTTVGEVDFYECLGNSWGVLFSHPADFTLVCTTELGKTALDTVARDKILQHLDSLLSILKQ